MAASEIAGGSQRPAEGSPESDLPKRRRDAVRPRLSDHSRTQPRRGAQELRSPPLPRRDDGGTLADVPRLLRRFGASCLSLPSSDGRQGGKECVRRGISVWYRIHNTKK